MIRNIKLCAISVALIVFVGCKNESRSEQYSADCNLTEIVKKISNTKGIIVLDTTANVFKMFSGIDGSYDSQGVSVICNLPAKFQKHDIEVLFSGAYYEYDGEVKNKVSGQSFYYLKLENIKSLE